MPHRAASLIALAVATFLAGCASARIRKENLRALAVADARVLEGCYGCLMDARTTYERLAREKKPLPGVIARLFESNVLLGLREKELGLDSRASIERAQAIAPRLPVTIDGARVLAIAGAVYSDNNALPLATADSIQASRQPFIKTIDAELVWIEQAPLTPAVRKYVSLAADCSYADRRKTPGDTVDHLAKRREVPINAPPLVAYRAAYCAKSDTFALKRVLVASETFDEVGYALALTLMWTAGDNGGDEALGLLDRAHRRFPRAAGVTFTTGWLNSNLGDCPAAVRSFDETLAIEPLHDRAMLQKTICLTSLKQDSAALATATQFIALGTKNIAEGYYWRAVTRLRRRELEMARADIEAAKARSRGGEVLSLAGMIEHEQADYGIAETDLRAARATHEGWKLCGAGFYLGSTLTKRQAWAQAAASFDSAMVCYDDRASETAAKLAKARESTRGSEAFRARRIATLESDLADRLRRSRTAAFNTASMNAKIGDLTRVEELLTIAAAEPDLTDEVGKLREQLAAIAQQTRQAGPPRLRPITPR